MVPYVEFGGMQAVTHVLQPQAPAIIRQGYLLRREAGQARQWNDIQPSKYGASIKQPLPRRVYDTHKRICSGGRESECGRSQEHCSVHYAKAAAASRRIIAGNHVQSIQFDSGSVVKGNVMNVYKSEPSPLHGNWLTTFFRGELRLNCLAKPTANRNT